MIEQQLCRFADELLRIAARFGQPSFELERGPDSRCEEATTVCDSPTTSFAGPITTLAIRLETAWVANARREPSALTASAR